MKAQKLFLAVILVSTFGLFSSCTKSDVSNDDQIFEQQAIDKKEIKEQDVM